MRFPSCCYPPPTKLRVGIVFSHICQSFSSGKVVPVSSPTLLPPLYNPSPGHVQTCYTGTLLNRDLFPRHVQTCSTRTSLYMDAPDKLKLLLLEPHCTATLPTHMFKLFQLYREQFPPAPPNMFKLFQLGHHCTAPPPTCSNLFTI